jgi:hypothetical protein
MFHELIAARAPLDERRWARPVPRDDVMVVTMSRHGGNRQPTSSTAGTLSERRRGRRRVHPDNWTQQRGVSDPPCFRAEQDRGQPRGVAHAPVALPHRLLPHHETSRGTERRASHLAATPCVSTMYRALPSPTRFSAVAAILAEHRIARGADSSRPSRPPVRAHPRLHAEPTKGRDVDTTDAEHGCRSGPCAA